MPIFDWTGLRAELCRFWREISSRPLWLTGFLILCAAPYVTGNPWIF